MEERAEGGTVVAHRHGSKGATEWEANRNPAEIVYLCRQDGSFNIEKIALHYIT